ncbi:MAG: hypothetical protein WCH43_15940 [Verrucomicrobiota bacterium]
MDDNWLTEALELVEAIRADIFSAFSDLETMKLSAEMQTDAGNVVPLRDES